MTRADKTPAELLAEGIAELGLEIDNTRQQAMLRYLELLERWNRAYNLTAVRELPEMVVRHLLDSLSISPYLTGQRILDVGTGAGLPGIPLALVHEEKTFVLLDSNGKKCRFVRQAVLELGLKNVEVVQSRVEHYRPDEPFDTIVTRAFAPLSDILARIGHLCHHGTRLLAMKSGEPEDEIAAAAVAPERLRRHRLHIPFSGVERSLLEITLEPHAGEPHG